VRSATPTFRTLSNRRGSDWWSIVFGYPVARLLLVVLARVPWITPTGITLFGFAVKCAAIYGLWDRQVVLAAVLLQAAQVFDSMDGTLARFRETSSRAGAYLDKVFDAVSAFALCLTVGWVAGSREALVCAAIGGGGLLISSYALWVARGVAPQTGERIDGGAPILTGSEIVREWFCGWLQIWRFQEADLYFWIALFAVLGEWQLLCYGLAITQALKALAVLVYRRPS
jgi:phosphatidylglycerophosphate synthase